jgi:hypothetical protein
MTCNPKKCGCRPRPTWPRKSHSKPRQKKSRTEERRLSRQSARWAPKAKADSTAAPGAGAVPRPRPQQKGHGHRTRVGREFLIRDSTRPARVPDCRRVARPSDRARRDGRAHAPVRLASTPRVLSARDYACALIIAHWWAWLIFLVPTVH